MSILSIIRETTNGTITNNPKKLFQKYTYEAIDTVAGNRKPNLDFKLTRVDLANLVKPIFDLDTPLLELAEDMSGAVSYKDISAALVVNEATEDFIEFMNNGSKFIRDLNHNDIISRYVYYTINNNVDYLPICDTEEFIKFLNNKKVTLRKFIAFIIAVYELPIALALLYCLDVLLNKKKGT